MSRVDIGFLEKTDEYLLKSNYFPSKIGGKPSWLALENLPTTEDLKCSTCSAPLTFLSQIYAPYEEDPENFHRTLFIFICKNPGCCKHNDNNNIKIWRSQLGRINNFYPSDPPNEDIEVEFDISKFLKLCSVCGCPASKHCSKCKITPYCSREHQILDWKSGHKTNCGTDGIKYENKSLYDEWSLIIEEEDDSKGDVSENKVDENEQMKIYEKLVEEGKTGTLNDVSEDELQNHADVKEDKTFLKFKKVVDKNPDQVLRYDRGGEPLWISETKPSGIPNCEYCGSERQFEFQILPQLLYVLKEDQVDFGTLLVYTCKKSCTEGDSYKREYIYKQDVANE